MSMDLKETCNLGGLWTNEKHLNFLNCIEATFVNSMVENGGLIYPSAIHPPLDRYIPDISDSTLDLQSRRTINRKRVYLPVDVDVLRSTTSEAGTEECYKRRSRQPRDESEDQVVPQIADAKADNINTSDNEIIASTEEEEVEEEEEEEEEVSVSPLHRNTS